MTKSVALKIEAVQLVQIGACDEPRYFSLEDALAIFPLVRRITADAYQELKPVKLDLENLLTSDPRISMVERRYEEIVKRWMNKMQRLGLVIKGLWLVDFDTGDGYLCWKYPELRLAHYHDYATGFSDRRSLQEVIEELAPDWA